MSHVVAAASAVWGIGTYVTKALLESAYAVVGLAETSPKERKKGVAPTAVRFQRHFRLI